MYWELVLGWALCWLVFFLIVDFSFFLCILLGCYNFLGDCFTIHQSPGSMREFNAASIMQGPLDGKDFKATDPKLHFWFFK